MELNNLDPDDVSDVFYKIEKSFGFTFRKADLANVSTFGQLCEMVIHKTNAIDLNDCTTQQAFYKLRNAIGYTLSIVLESIKPHHKLAFLLPKPHLRKRVREIESLMGFKLHILNPQNWIVRTLSLLLIVGLVGLFFSWHISLPVAITVLISFKIAYLTGTKISDKTIGQIAERVTKKALQASKKKWANDK